VSESATAFVPGPSSLFRFSGVDDWSALARDNHRDDV
jgi:hypothetical protein